MRKHLVPYVHKVDRNGTHSQVAEGTRDPSLKWKGKFTGSNPVLTAKQLKIKVMKKEKTYFDGIMIGFAITAIIYSVLLGVVIRMLTA